MKRIVSPAIGLAAAMAAVVSGTVVGDAAARDQVAFDSGGALPGTIVIRTTERRLYLVLDGGTAIRYPVGVGRADRQWTGPSTITGKFVRPNWAPPAAVKRDKPSLPNMIPGGAANNPMGVAAMTLAGGDYAIHGTNSPKSIGGFVSYGCIRMFNEDIIHLYDRVRVGTPVFVTR